jgi:hypothetical protein
MNYINKIRDNIKAHFNGQTIEKGDFASFISPSKKFRADTTNCHTKNANSVYTLVEIYEQVQNQKILDFFTNEDRFLHGWGIANEIEYLITAEDIYGGQTIVDLTNRKLYGYSPDESGFIMTDFHLSPNGKTLATIGCYWACPFVIKFFDFTNPTKLPLREIKEIELLDNDENIVGWLDEETLQMEGIKREKEKVYMEDGGFTMKIISEIKVNRQIKINSKDGI